MRIVDLCCGAGGFSLGFADQHNSVIGVDIWHRALDTYRLNLSYRFRQCEVMQVDIRDVDPTTFGQVDILIGSPPCPPFSGANIRGKRDKDPAIVNQFFNLLDILKPRWWVMEESPNAAFLVPFSQFRRFQVATDHGLYMQRRRLFAGNYPSVFPTRRTRKIHPSIRAQEKKAFNKNMKHSRKAQSCCQWFGRRLASWELQVLMGFPGDYEFLGDYEERCIQIGNAVCPPISTAIYNAIKKGWDW